MADTLGQRTDSRQYRAPRSVRQDSALSRYVAQGGSRTVGGAHQKEIRTWATACQFIACYSMERATRAIERLRAAMRTTAARITMDRKLQLRAKDRNADTAWEAFLLNPNPTTKETAIRAMYAEAAEQVEFCRDFESEDAA